MMAWHARWFLTPQTNLPLFAFAPRYPLGLERGLTRAEVRSRLGSRLTEVERLVLVAADGAAVDACVAVYPVGSDAQWMLDWGGGSWGAGEGRGR